MRSLRRGLLAGALSLMLMSALAAAPQKPSAKKADRPAPAPKPAPKEDDEIAQADQSGPAAALLGKTFDSLTVVSETGEALDIAKQKGWKVVYFWSPYCPCVKACQSLSLFPLARTYAKQPKEGQAPVSFYAVASNASNLLKRPLADGTERVLLNVPGGLGQSPPYPIVLDPGHKLADQLKAGNTPQTYLFDPDGKLVFVGNPDDSEEVRIKTGRSGEMTKNYLSDALQDALAGRKLKRARTPALGCDIDRTDVEPVAKAD